MSNQYILAIDQGTTGTRASLLNREGDIVAKFYREFTQYFPRAGWVEHDPEEIWQSTLQVIQKVLSETKIKSSDIAGIGISNQRETTILWGKDTGRPLYKAIVWQCRRTAPICDKLKKDGLQEKIGEDKRKNRTPHRPLFFSNKDKVDFG